MIQKYTFFDGVIEFDDTRSVRELIRCAFNEFDYYEPFGMNTVTLFQCHHSKTNTGWLTTNVNLSCAEEIENRDELCFAYHMPDVFYYAEGGWGHHMKELGNHPEINNPTSLYFRCEDFDHTVVFNGDLTMEKILSLFKDADYFPKAATSLRIHAINPYQPPYSIRLTETVLNMTVESFKKSLPNSVIIIEFE